MRILARDGRPLDAELDIDVDRDRSFVILHASGGASRGRPAQNPDYIEALETVLTRLKDARASIGGVWVDSTAVAHLTAEQREVRPGGREFPIDLDAVDDISEFRLQIRRGVSRVGARSADTVGTGNKRIRILVLAVDSRPDRLKALLDGSEAVTGYWRLDLRDDQFDVGLVSTTAAVAVGHLVAVLRSSARDLESNSCDIWQVMECLPVGPNATERFPSKTCRLVRVAGPVPVDLNLFNGVAGFGLHGHYWSAIDEPRFTAFATQCGWALEDLPISTEVLMATIERAGEAVHSAPPVVRERISQFIERGIVGEKVKRAKGYRCQVCEALGLPTMTFVKPDGVPFVEAHHVVPVSTLEQNVLGAANVVVLCANHHRQLHFGGVVVSDEGTHFQFTFPADNRLIAIRKFADGPG